MSSEQVNIPSNKDINQAMQTVKTELRQAQRSADQTPGLDSTGKQILRDTEKVIDSAQAFLEEKNRGDKIQKIILEGRKALDDISGEAERVKDEAKKAGKELSKEAEARAEKLRETAEKLLDTARSAGYEVVMSSSFRRSMRAFLQLLYDIVSDTVIEQLPAVQEGIQRLGQDLQDKVKEGHQHVAKSLEPIIENKDVMEGIDRVGEGLQQVVQQGQEALQGGLEEGKRKMQEGQSRQPLQQQQSGTSSKREKLTGEQQHPLQPQQNQPGFTLLEQQESIARQQHPEQTQQGQGKKKGGRGGKGQQLAEGVAGKLQEAKEAIQSEAMQWDTQDVKETLEENLNQGLSAVGIDHKVRIPKERLDELVHRFREMLREIAKNEKAKRVFTDLMDLIHDMSQQLGIIADKAKDKGEQAKDVAADSAENVLENKHLKRCLHLAKQIFESFAGEGALDPIMDHLEAIYDIAAKDTLARGIFSDLRTYINKVFKDPSILDKGENAREIRRIIKRYRRLPSEELKQHLSAIIDESKKVLRKIKKDPTTLRLKNDMKKLITDLMLDESGNLTFKPEVLQQLRIIVLNSLTERMKIPVPDIRHEEGDSVYVLRNIMVRVKDLLPDSILIEDKGKIHLDLTKPDESIVEDASNRLSISIKNMNIVMDNVDIKYVRYSFPRMGDEGKLDVSIGGRGLDVHVDLLTLPVWKSRKLFEIKTIECDVHDLDLSLSDTSHDFVYSLLLPLIKHRFRTIVETGIEDAMRNMLEQLNRIASKYVVQKGRNLIQGI